MDEVKSSTIENPYIGTNGLCGCIGVLCYVEEKKKAIVCHISIERIVDGKCLELDDVALHWLHKLKDFLKINDVDIENDLIKILILRSDMKQSEKVDEFLYNFGLTILAYFKKYEVFNENELEENSIKIDHNNDNSLEFVFDASTGKFVTDLFYPNDENYKLKNLKEEAKLNF